MMTLVSHPQGDAVTHGIDAHYLSADGRWNADAQLMFSDTADITGSGGFVDFNYSPFRGKQHQLGLEYFDDELDINDLGFLRRNDSIGGTYRYTMTESDGWCRNGTASLKQSVLCPAPAPGTSPLAV